MMRRLSARLNYLAADRPELQYASKGISQHMAKPTKKAMRKLRRVGRFLVGAGRSVQRFPWIESSAVDKVHGYGDSDWAADKSTGRSTSGGAIVWDGHLLKSWSSSQQTVAMSSGEAELYALTRLLRT